MYILQITAVIDLKVWIPIMCVIIGAITNVLVIKKMKSDSKEKLATKGFVLDKISTIDTNISKVENKFDNAIKEHKKDNIREHDSIKTEFHNTVKALDHKFDTIITLLRDKDKSA